MRFEKIFLGSGHMIDAADRKDPRFPGDKAEAVRGEISRRLNDWKMHANDLAICGGACGADTLFGEEALRRGAHLHLSLAQEPEEFLRNSVQHAGDEWVRRFRALCEKAEVEVLEDGEGDIYARANLRMIEMARAAADASSQLYTLLVWDEKSTGDGTGGTSDFERRVRDLGSEIAVINPTKL